MTDMQLNMAHTPGPWNHIVKMDGFTAVGAKTLIARVFSAAFKDLANEEANARLIAAAPELLTALKEAREVLNSCATDTAGTPSEKFFQSKVRHCDTVIARAERAA